MKFHQHDDPDPTGFQLINMSTVGQPPGILPPVKTPTSAPLITRLLILFLVSQEPVHEARRAPDGSDEEEDDEEAPRVVNPRTQVCPWLLLVVYISLTSP